MSMTELTITEQIAKSHNPFGIRSALKRGLYAGMAVRNVPEGWATKYYRTQHRLAHYELLYKTASANEDFIIGYERGLRQ